MGKSFIHKGQRGFTLIELLIAIAITGVIAGGITMTIMQVFNINTRTSGDMTAVRQVQQAGFWVSPDVQMAQSVNASGSQGFPLILTWTEIGGNHTVHKVIYTLVDMSGGLERLERDHYIGNETSPDSTTIVAEYIDPDPAKTSCKPLGPLQPGVALNFTVTATLGGRSETRVYEVEPRPGSQ
jgi:prepilin-type N-terminal cleavage/methylation domain-containing protein